VRRSLNTRAWPLAPLLALLLSGCPYAPAEEGYAIRAPRSGPSKVAPDGFAWEQQGECRNERQRDVYNNDTTVVKLCDWVLVRESAPSGAASASASVSPVGCTKDTDCKGKRICVKDRCAAPED
jgi:hypothetical protein